MKSAFAETEDDGSCLYTAPNVCDFIAPEGKHFAGWSQSQDGAISDKFTLTGDTTLYAVWADGIYLSSVTMFACANADAGLNSNVPITFTASGSSYHGTLLLPGDVDISRIRLSWTNGATVSDGVNIYAQGEAPIASEGNSVSYTVTAADGSAVFTVQTICEASCIIDKSVSLQEGELMLTIDGVNLGTFTFAKSGSSWTIRDANNKYIGISNKALSRSSTAFKWTYSNKKFSASVSSYSGWSTPTTTYYLTVSNGALSVSTSNRNNTAAFLIHTESDTQFWRVDSGIRRNAQPRLLRLRGNRNRRVQIRQ